MLLSHASAGLLRDGEKLMIMMRAMKTFSEVTE